MCIQTKLFVIIDTSMKIKYLIFLTCLYVVFAPTYSYAYLDPGTGSIIIQAIVAFFAAVGGVCSLYWRKITSIFKRKSDKKDHIDKDK